MICQRCKKDYPPTQMGKILDRKGNQHVICINCYHEISMTSAKSPSEIKELTVLKMDSGKTLFCKQCGCYNLTSLNNSYTCKSCGKDPMQRTTSIEYVSLLFARDNCIRDRDKYGECNISDDDLARAKLLNDKQEMKEDITHLIISCGDDLRENLEEMISLVYNSDVRNSKKICNGILEIDSREPNAIMYGMLDSVYIDLAGDIAATPGGVPDPSQFDEKSFVDIFFDLKALAFSSSFIIKEIFARYGGYDSFVEEIYRWMSVIRTAFDPDMWGLIEAGSEKIASENGWVFSQIKEKDHSVADAFFGTFASRLANGGNELLGSMIELGYSAGKRRAEQKRNKTVQEILEENKIKAVQKCKEELWRGISDAWYVLYNCLKDEKNKIKQYDDFITELKEFFTFCVDNFEPNDMAKSAIENLYSGIL